MNDFSADRANLKMERGNQKDDSLLWIFGGIIGVITALFLLS